MLKLELKFDDTRMREDRKYAPEAIYAAVDKAFGSLCYDFALSRYSRDYCVKTLEQSILETERT